MKKILILCSAYNGFEFIGQQIKSVLSQVDVSFDMLIRDDGSSDDTVEIIKQYQKKHANIFLIEGENCGSANSFMKLVYEAYINFPVYDYYAFCDQDDVWLPQKLKVAVDCLDGKCGNNYKLYLGSYQMVDSNLNELLTPQIKPTLNIESAFVSNPATGCTMVFNRELLEAVAKKRPNYMIMHDYWIYLSCLAMGGYVFFDSIPYILYRQHSHNVIGGKKDPFFKKWIVRIKKLFKKGDCFKSKMAAQLIECYNDVINDYNKEFLYQVSTCKKTSSKINLIKNEQFRGDSLDKNLQLLGLIITGKL